MQETKLKSTEQTPSSTKSVLLLCDIDFIEIETLLSKYELELLTVPKDSPIPGSFWGDEEAGLVGNLLYARADTPIHSILHESCHFICMDERRRSNLDTNAGGDYDEENAVCYLQILLADSLPSMGKERMMQDMDSWGYTFRLGSSNNWFLHDADDAKQWLEDNAIIQAGMPTYLKRI